MMENPIKKNDLDPVAVFQESESPQVSSAKWVWTWKHDDSLIHYRYQWTYTLLPHGKTIRREEAVVSAENQKGRKGERMVNRLAKLAKGHLGNLQSKPHMQSQWCPPVMWCLHMLTMLPCKANNSRNSSQFLEHRLVVARVCHVPRKQAPLWCKALQRTFDFKTSLENLQDLIVFDSIL